MHRRLVRFGRNRFPVFHISYSFFPSGQQKKPVLDKFCQGRADQHSRCHLDSRKNSTRFAGYQHIPGHLRRPSRRRILSKNSFPCALGGPFDSLVSIRLTAKAGLSGGTASAVISASTVFKFVLTLAQHAGFVNRDFITVFLLCVEDKRRSRKKTCSQALKPA